MEGRGGGQDVGQEVASKMGARYGRLAILDDVSFAEKPGKAMPSWDHVALEFGFLGPESETVFGLRFRAQKWSRLLRNLKHR